MILDVGGAELGALGDIEDAGCEADDVPWGAELGGRGTTTVYEGPSHVEETTLLG